MKKIDELTETFKSRLDAFTIGCDSIEEIELWNKEENGELDVFCLNEYLTTTLRLVAADGVISEQEAEYVNKNFGFSYTADELFKKSLFVVKSVVFFPLWLYGH